LAANDPPIAIFCSYLVAVRIRSKLQIDEVANAVSFPQDGLESADPTVTLVNLFFEDLCLFMD
jgi:hypothetical protein